MANNLQKPKRGWIITALFLSLGGLLFVYFFSGSENGLEFLLEVQPSYLIAAFLFVVICWLLDALRLKVALNITGENLSLFNLFVNSLATAFMAGITPLAAGGPPAQIYFFYRQGIDLEKGFSVSTVRMLLNFIFFIVVTPIALILFYQALELEGFMSFIILIAVLLMAGGIAAFLYFLYRPELVEKAAFWLLRRRFLGENIRNNALKWAKTVHDQVLRFNICLKMLVLSGQKLRLFLLALLTVFYWLIFFSIALLLIRGLGYQTPPLITVMRQVVYYFLINYVPLPGASGVAEIGFAATFSSLLPKSILTPFVILWRLFTYYTNLLFGGFAFWYVSRKTGIS